MHYREVLELLLRTHQVPTPAHCMSLAKCWNESSWAVDDETGVDGFEEPGAGLAEDGSEDSPLLTWRRVW